MNYTQRFAQGLTVMRKELLGFFETPTAYIVAVLFLGISEFLFFKSAFTIGEASLFPYVSMLQWFLLFVVPALVMGVFATERESGTYETLATRPLTEWEIVGGKFVAVVLFLTGLLTLAFAPIAASFSFFGSIDWGVVFAGWLSGVFLAAMFTATGMFVSSLFHKQVTALLAAIALNFFFIIVGLDVVTQAAPLTLALFLERVSALSHMLSMARGVIDIRDLWYFISMIVAFLALTQYRLLVARFAGRQPTLMRWRVGVLIVVAIALVSNVLGSAIPGRFDLTAEGTYTLSDTTRSMLGNLDDVVNITLYASGRLPSQLQPNLRQARDILKDYERYGKGNVVFNVKDPDSSEDVAREAQMSGVTTQQFQIVSRGEYQVKQGYLGVALSHGGQTESVPFIEDTGDLEYLLTSKLAKLTTTERKHVSFLTSSGAQGRSAFNNFATELEKVYDVSDLALATSTGRIASGTDVLIIADPKEVMSERDKGLIDNFLNEGGAVLALIGGVSVEQSALSATPRDPSLLSLFAKYGVTVNPNLAYDLRSSEVVQMGGGGGRAYLMQYPFWMRTQLLQGSPVTAKLQSMLVPWGSTISIDQGAATGANATVTPIIATTQYAGVLTDSFDITPNQKLSQNNLTSRVLGVSVSGGGEHPARLVLIGNSTFLSDQITGQGPENLALGLSAVSWLAQDESLAAIKVKSGVRRTLTFGSQAEQLSVQYGNLAFGVLIPLLVAAVFFMRRRSVKRYTYSSRPVKF